jgi:hypothetical protein
MRRSTAFVVLALSALAIAVALPCDAGVPTPNTSTVPTHLLLVGRDANGNPDPNGLAMIIVRRFTTTVPGSVVYFDFTQAPDLRLCTDQPDADIHVGCPTNPSIAYGYTDSNGQLSFTLVGRADHSQPAGGQASVRIYADGVPFGTIPVGALDHDGDGMSPADQSLWMQDFFSGAHLERADLDGDGIVGPADLSVWLEAFFAAGSTSGCAGALCPPQ